MDINTTIIVALAFIWSAILPNISSQILVFVDNLLVRALAILLILFTLNLGPVEGGAILLAVGLTFLERNRRKIASIMSKTSLGNDNVPQNSTIIDQVLSAIGLGEPVASVKVSENTFVPKSGQGCNAFSNVGESQDGKRIYSSQPLGEKAAKIY